MDGEFEHLFLLLVEFLYRVYIFSLGFYCTITIFIELFLLFAIEFELIFRFQVLIGYFCLILCRILYRCGRIYHFLA